MSARLLRYGTGAHLALSALHSLDGQALGVRWQAAAAQSLGAKAREEQWDVIVHTLISASMVFQRSEVFLISDDGLEWLGVAAEVVPRAEPLAAPARYVAPMRPLASKHLVNVRATREGAFDYRDIPSLHGTERVAFKTSLKVSGMRPETQEGARR